MLNIQIPGPLSWDSHLVGMDWALQVTWEFQQVLGIQIWLHCLLGTSPLSALAQRLLRGFLTGLLLHFLPSGVHTAAGGII